MQKRPAAPLNLATWGGGRGEETGGAGYFLFSVGTVAFSRVIIAVRNRVNPLKLIEQSIMIVRI